MSRRVQLPPGCSGFTTARGETLKAKPGTSVVLDDADARSLARSQHVSAGLLSARELFAIGTRKSRWCPRCSFHAQAWTETCPRCQAATVSGEGPRAQAAAQAAP